MSCFGLLIALICVAGWGIVLCFDVPCVFCIGALLCKVLSLLPACLGCYMFVLIVLLRCVRWF